MGHFAVDSYCTKPLLARSHTQLVGTDPGHHHDGNTYNKTSSSTAPNRRTFLHTLEPKTDTYRTPFSRFSHTAPHKNCHLPALSLASVVSMGDDGHVVANGMKNGLVSIAENSRDDPRLLPRVWVRLRGGGSTPYRSPAAVVIAAGVLESGGEDTVSLTVIVGAGARARTHWLMAAAQSCVICSWMAVSNIVIRFDESQQYFNSLGVTAIARSRCLELVLYWSICSICDLNGSQSKKLSVSHLFTARLRITNRGALLHVVERLCLKYT